MASIPSIWEHPISWKSRERGREETLRCGNKPAYTVKPSAATWVCLLSICGSKTDVFLRKEVENNMDAFVLLRNPKKCKTMFFAFLVSGFLWTSPAAASEMMSTVCNNQVVSVGARR